MLKRAMFAGLLVLAGAMPSYAQAARGEVGVFGGWSFSDGVSGNSILAGDGNIYDRVDPKDSGTFGFNAGVFITPNWEAGFLYTYQGSKMVLGGTNEFELGDLSINTYHGYLAYNFGGSGHIHPFLFGGLGATNFGSVNFSTPLRSGTIGGETQFSSTWGGGIKAMASPHVGIRVAAQWTPTYIKTDSAGWWCDPYWGCYLVGNAQYANQFMLTGGVAFRF
jgi:hypothetical protein